MAGKNRLDRVGNGENKCAQAVVPIEVYEIVANRAKEQFVSAGHIYRAWILEGFKRDSKNWKKKK